MSGPRRKPRALILAPTRELAEQTHLAFRQLGSQTGCAPYPFTAASVSNLSQPLAEWRGYCGGCPGRLLDLKNQRPLTFLY